jgi:hypothetical protein
MGLAGDQCDVGVRIVLADVLRGSGARDAVSNDDEA